MKKGASVRKICKSCRLIRRKGRIIISCPKARHKQRQG